MDWVQDMTARWVRILSAAGAGSTPLDEAVQQISEIGESGGVAGQKGRPGRLKRNAATREEASAVTALSRQLVAGVLLSDLLADRLCALTGQTRGQLLEQLSGSLPRELQAQQLRALKAEVSGSCALLRDPERPSTYAGLGSRVEQLLRLTEVQASELIDAARTEAAQITSSAGTQQPCPRCGAR